SSLPGINRQRGRLFVVRERKRLVDQAPAQARPQVFAQRQRGERHPARSKQPPTALLQRVVQGEDQRRRRGIGLVDPIVSDQHGPVPCRIGGDRGWVLMKVHRNASL